MTGKIKKLKEEIAILENQTSLLYGEVRETYSKYLNTLSQSVKKQLILAVYHVCTQSYPQDFLKLSYSERQKVQEKIKNIGNTAESKLQNYLNKTHELDFAPLEGLNLMEKMFLELSNFDPESEEEEPEEQKPEQKPELEVLSTIESSEENIQIINNPNQLVNWCKIIEQGITTTLDDLSKQVNHILQESHILPSQLPPQVLDMAIQAEEAGQAMSGNPNLLNVIVETGQKNLDENSEEPEIPSKITKITAVHLRLVEMEFADASLSVQHKVIRNLLEKVSQLKKQYRHKQREFTIAEAEAAWRASWYEQQ